MKSIPIKDYEQEEFVCEVGGEYCLKSEHTQDYSIMKPVAGFSDYYMSSHGQLIKFVNGQPEVVHPDYDSKPEGSVYHLYRGNERVTLFWSKVFIMAFYGECNDYAAGPWIKKPFELLIDCTNIRPREEIIFRLYLGKLGEMTGEEYEQLKAKHYNTEEYKGFRAEKYYL